MCGRFEIHSALEIIAKVFGIDEITFDYQPNYNVAPSQDIILVVHDRKRRLVRSRWGFVPSWSKDLKTGYRMINARADTVAVKRTFKSALENQRCLVVADGFYEWQKAGRTKKPMYIRLKSGKPFGFAGLYNTWTSPEGEAICTSMIITTDANELLRPIHDRMPVITPPDAVDLWLDPKIHDSSELLPILKPYPSEEMEYYPVSPKVNSYKYNAPENVQRTT
jgi:putative SOS response-associated peptidase YedK